MDDPRGVDADVPGRVGRTLRKELRARIEEAEEIDPVFARDIAERLARFTLDGGKRVRSQFLWWGFRACGGGGRESDTGVALRLAAGLELIQTCALVHDDVMDGSRLRRGRPAVHADLAALLGDATAPDRAGAFGRSAAILVGDLALAWADDVVADTLMAPEARRRVRTVWRAMRTEMVAGQYLDVHGSATASRSVARALRTACLKTALYTVERPLALGAALAGATEGTTRALCAAGRCAGTAFQLRDDLLSVFGDPQRTGKPSGGDIREGKPTYLVAVARARAEAEGDRNALAVLDTALGDPGLTEDGLARVRGVLEATGARTAVESKISRLTGLCAGRLASAELEPAAGHRLHALLRTIAGAPRGRTRAEGPAGAPTSAPATTPVPERSSR